MGFGLFQTSSGGQSTPTPPTIIWYEVTRADALALITASTVVKGAGYLITDRSIVLYGDNANGFKLEGSFITNAFIQDVVHYDIINDLITYRRDKNGNQVSCSTGIGPFPFNNSLCYNNTINGKFSITVPDFGFYGNEITGNEIFFSVITNNVNRIYNNKISGSLITLTGNTFNIFNNDIVVEVDFKLINLKSGGFSFNQIYSKSFEFDNSSNINTNFILFKCVFRCYNNINVDMAINSHGAQHCSITCDNLLISISSESTEGKYHVSEYDYTLTDYFALDEPALKEESEFSLIGRNFSLGTKICFASSLAISTSGTISVLSVTLNSHIDASIYVWQDGPSNIEFATGIDENFISECKNIRVWNRSTSNKYIVFQKQNGLPQYKGQFFSETETVITLRQNEYADFQLSTTISGFAYPVFYQLIYASPQEVKSDVTFEGNAGAPKFRTVNPGGGSLTISGPTMTEPFTKGVLSIGGGGGSVIRLSHSDSNVGAYPLRSLDSNYKSCFIKIRAKQLVVGTVNMNIYLGYVSGILSNAGEGVTGISITNGIVSTVSQINGNPSIVTDILPPASIPSDTDWHEYSTIITSKRIIFLYDNKIIQVTNNKPVVSFVFARGVLIHRLLGGAPTYNLLIEKYIYSDL